MLSRRQFFVASAAAVLTAKLSGQSARIDVAAVERKRVLDAAESSFAIGEGLRDICYRIATQSAAFVIAVQPLYAGSAIANLRGLVELPATAASAVDLIPVAEAAVGLRFLVDFIHEKDLAAMNAWLTAVQAFLHSDPAMMLERERHDHRASAWLLVSSAIARLQRDDKTLEENRRLFRRPTLRNQINAQGEFTEEMATPNPYRNTLFNFDLLCGVCELLASPFDLLWEYELPDGPGMRAASAFVFPVVQDRNKWPGVSDAEHFRELPGRRAGLLFAGRAYNRPEYVELWRKLPPEIPADLEATFPIREPVLWVTRAQHGL
jgi:hypothetical protein